MNQFVRIDDVVVRQDGQGRYRLNDLHRASGGEKRHQPSNFLQLLSTQELIQAIQETPPGIPGGPVQVINLSQENVGTYVARELVYAYAMWVSPAFHLKVIRTFDAVAQADRQGQEVFDFISNPSGPGNPRAPGLPASYAEALYLAGQQAERIRALEEQLVARERTGADRPPDPGSVSRQSRQPAEHPWAGLLRAWLASRTDVHELTSYDLFEALGIEWVRVKPRAQQALGRIMSSLGWGRARRRTSGRLRWVYVRPEAAVVRRARPACGAAGCAGCDRCEVAG